MEDNYTQQNLEDWVIDKCNQWRDHYDTNYREKHKSTIVYGEVSGLVKTHYVSQSVLN